MALRFKPGLASTVMLSFLLPMLVALGIWQLDRAKQKRALFAQYQTQLNAKEIGLEQIINLSEVRLIWRRIRVSGEYVAPNILLDNRIRDSRAGYEVFTPFSYGHNQIVLVNRGWIPADPSRKLKTPLDLPHGQQTLIGRIGPIPWNGINLGTPTVEQLNPMTLRLTHLIPSAVEPFIKLRLPTYVILLDAEQNDGFDRTWPTPTLDDGKHRAYAFQWFTMAFVLIIIYLKINFVSSSK